MAPMPCRGKIQSYATWDYLLCSYHIRFSGNASLRNVVASKRLLLQWTGEARVPYHIHVDLRVRVRVPTTLEKGGWELTVGQMRYFQHFEEKKKEKKSQTGISPAERHP